MRASPRAYYGVMGNGPTGQRYVLLLSLAAAGCWGRAGGDFEERVGNAEQRLQNIGATVDVTASAPNATVGNEAAAATVSMTSTDSVVFVSYNSNHNVAQGDGKYTHCAWAQSDITHGVFQSWDSYYTPLPASDTSTGSPLVRCQGDTWAAALGPQRLRQVLMVAVTEAQDSTNDVVLYSSIHAGANFSSATRVSTDGSGTKCDGPKVAADPSNNATYVWWFNNLTNNKRHYLRRADIAANGSIALGPLRDLTGLLPGVAAPAHATIAVKPANAAGLPPRIFLAYATKGMLLSSCAIGVSQTLAVTWYFAYSDDEGVSWTSTQVDSDASWPRCQFQSPASPPDAVYLGGNRSYISSAYDPVSGRLLLAYQRHDADSGGSYVGTRVHLKEWPRADGQPGFDDWVPPCGPSNCLTDQPLRVGEPYCVQFSQSLAVRPVGGASSRVAMVWHDTRDTSPSYPNPAVGDAGSRNLVQSDLFGGSIRPGPPIDQCPNTQGRITFQGGGVPWLPNGTNGWTWWGDYEQGLVDGGGNFFTVWSDNRDGSTLTRLKGLSFQDGP